MEPTNYEAAKAAFIKAQADRKSGLITDADLRRARMDFAAASDALEHQDTETRQ